MDTYDENLWWANPGSQAEVLSDSVRMRDNDTKPLLDLREMLVGPHYGGGVGDRAVEKPTNTVYAYYSRYYSTVLGGAIEPIVEVEPGSPEEPLGIGYERATLDVWNRQEGEKVAELVFGDMCCGYGAMLVTAAPAMNVKLSEADRSKLKYPMGPLPWTDYGADPASPTPRYQVDASPMTPEVHYLDPKHVGWDRRAPTIEQGEYWFYETTHAVDELIAQAKAEEEVSGQTMWDIGHLEQIASSYMDHKEANLGGSKDMTHMESDYVRRFITLTTLIVKTAVHETEERPANHNAMLYVLHMPLRDSAHAVWVRKPEWHFVPPWGPIQLFYQHSTGEDSTPFSALTANKTKVVGTDQAHAVALRRLRRMKTVTAVAGKSRQSADRLEGAKDMQAVTVAGIEDLRSGIMDVTFGGLDAPTFAAIEYFDRQVAQDLGLDSAARGATAGGDVTATETSEAAAQSGSRAAQFAAAFNRGMAGVFRTIAWYIAHSADFVTRADMATRAKEHTLAALRQADLERQLIEGGVVSEDELGPGAGQISREEAATVGRRAALESSGLFQGGDFGSGFGQEGSLDFSALRFKINARKQRYRSTEGRRMEAREFLADLTNLLVSRRQHPEYTWDEEFAELEENYGRRGILEALQETEAQLMQEVQVEQGLDADTMQLQPSADRKTEREPRIVMGGNPGGVGGRTAALERAASQNGTS